MYHLAMHKTLYFSFKILQFAISQYRDFQLIEINYSPKLATTERSDIQAPITPIVPNNNVNYKIDYRYVNVK